MQFLDKVGVQRFKQYVDETYATKQQVDDNALVTSAALNDLNDRVSTIEDSMGDVEYATKQELDDNALVTSSALNDINDRLIIVESEAANHVTAEEYSVIESVVRDTYTKQEIDTMLADIDGGSADLTNYYTKSQSDARYAQGTIPTKISQLSNDVGVLTSESDPVFTASAAAGITASDITNWNSKTSNTGTVTQVKVGTTAYNPSNGVVSLPAYPSTVTESTVSGWGFTKNTGTITGITMNGASKGTSGVINLGTVLTEHQDISGKADKSVAISSLGLSLDSSNYKLTLSGTKADGTTFTVSDVIDLPLESVVVGGSYNNTTRKVVLTLQNGNTIEFSVADLISGLQTQITSTNKLSADLISDGTTNKVVTATEKSTWNAKQDAISDIDTIRSNATAGAAKVSNVQSNWNATSGLAQILNKPTLATVATSGSYNDLSDKPSIPSSVTESTVSGWGFTKNTGTVTKVKVGNTEYNPSSGIVSLPAYPTTLPASDVSSWAKASTKPTYTASEVGALPDTTVIPAAANDSTITIQKGGTTVDSFTTNASSAKTINIPNELPAHSASNNGQILGVANGALTWITPTQIYSGSSAPNNSTGNNGDVYLQI